MTHDFTFTVAYTGLDQLGEEERRWAANRVGDLDPVCVYVCVYVCVCVCVCVSVRAYEWYVLTSNRTSVLLATVSVLLTLCVCVAY